MGRYIPVWSDGWWSVVTCCGGLICSHNAVHCAGWLGASLIAPQQNEYSMLRLRRMID